MLILDLSGISFHAVVIFGLGKNLLFKSMLGRCVLWGISVEKYLCVHKCRHHFAKNEEGKHLDTPSSYSGGFFPPILLTYKAGIILQIHIPSYTYTTAVIRSIKQHATPQKTRLKMHLVQDREQKNPRYKKDSIIFLEFFPPLNTFHIKNSIYEGLSLNNLSKSSL